MGACASRDATTAPSAHHTALPSHPANPNKSSIDLSQPRSSPPSITHTPLPSTLPDPDGDPHSRPRAHTLVSQSRGERPPVLPVSVKAVLPGCVEVRAEKEVVWALHGGEGGADSGLLDVVGGGEEGEVMTAGADKCVVRFDWQRRSVRDRWKAHSMPVERLLYDPHSRAVFTASRDSNIRMFTSSPSPSSSSSPAAAAAASLSSAAPADVIFRGHTLSVSALCFDSVLSSSLSSSPPTVLVSGGRDYSLRWWDIATQQQQQMRILPANIVTTLTATSQPHTLLSANTAGIVHHWDSRTHELAHTYDALDAAPVVALAASRTSPLVLVTHSPAGSAGSGAPANSSVVRLWDVRTQRVLRETPIDEALVASYVLPGGSELAGVRMVTVSAGGAVRMWVDGECVSSARVRGDSGVLRCASMSMDSDRTSATGSPSADGRSVLLYTGSTDGNVCVWSVRDSRLAAKALIRSRLAQ